MHELEAQMALLNETSDPRELVQKYEAAQAQNAQLLKQWEELSYELEILENEGLPE